MPLYLASADRSMPLNASARTSDADQQLLEPGHTARDVQPSNSGLLLEQRRGIHSLPPEVIARIFLLGANYDYPYANSPFLLKPDGQYQAIPSFNFQLLVCQICRVWRRIALDMASLWSVIHFRGRKDIDRGKEFIKRCEARTKPYPIDVLIETVEGDRYTPPLNLFTDEMEDIFQFIVPRIGMWRSLHLKVRCNECKLIARKYLSTCGGAPLLETLQLYHFEDFKGPDGLHLATHRRPVICFSNDLPSLKNVSMVGVNLPWDVSPYVTKLDHLEMALHVDFTRPAYQDWRSIIYDSPDLKTLAIMYSGPMPRHLEPFPEPRNIWPKEHERHSLQNLERLSLIDPDDPVYLCEYMRHLVFPSLTHLNLELPGDDYSLFIQFMTGNGPKSANGEYFLPSPFPSLGNLQSLTLTELHCNKTCLKDILMCLTGLLTLEMLDVPNELFELLVEGVSIRVPLQGSQDNLNEGSRALDLVNSTSSLTTGGSGINAANGTDQATLSTETDSVNDNYTTAIVPLLPRLQTLKAVGLTFGQIDQFNEHRRKAGYRLPIYRDEGGGNYQTYRIKHLIIGYHPSRVGMDPRLDKMVAERKVDKDIRVETFDDQIGEEEDEEEDEEYDYEEGEEEEGEEEEGEEGREVEEGECEEDEEEVEYEEEYEEGEEEEYEEGEEEE